MKKQIIIASVAIALLLIGGFVVYLYYINDNRELTTREETQTVTDDPSVDPAEDNNLPTKDTEVNQGEEDEPNDVSSNDDASANISRAYQNNANNLVVETQLKGIQQGECTITVVGPGGETTTESAEVFYVPNQDEASCLGFEISEVELSEGKNTITLTVTTFEQENYRDNISLDISL